MLRIFIDELKDGKLETTIRTDGYNYSHFGLVICDLVRHVANAYKVHENDVWNWVDMERDKPTTEVKEIKKV